MTQRRKQRREQKTIAVRPEQHSRYRELLGKTGLQPIVFMDRLLQLGERNIPELVGLRAVS